MVLPAFNEAPALRLLLGRMAVAVPNPGATAVIVVDDGSTDDTARVGSEFAELVVETVSHGENRGLGAAIATGFECAVRRGGEGTTVVTMDADDTHDPAVIVSMLARIERGYDIVIASRYERGGQEIGLSPVRSILSRGASVILAGFLPVPGVRDYTCGFRAYSWSALSRALRLYPEGLVQERGFTCMAEVLVKMTRIGARTAEVPLVLRYDRKTGASKMRVVRTVLAYGRLIAVLRRLPSMVAE